MPDLKFNSEAITPVKILCDIVKSDTQSIKVVEIEKDGKRAVSIQKWWKRKESDPWLEGKGFHLSLEEAEEVRKALDLK